MPAGTAMPRSRFPGRRGTEKPGRWLASTNNESNGITERTCEARERSMTHTVETAYRWFQQLEPMTAVVACLAVVLAASIAAWQIGHAPAQDDDEESDADEGDWSSEGNCAPRRWV